MLTYTSFLRGVNMTGHNSIKMTDLNALYKDIGFKDPETFIQSGNVIFRSEKDLGPEEISGLIEKAIFSRYGYTVPAIIRTVPELKNIISSNPFLGEEKFDPSKMAVIFVYEKMMEDHIKKVSDIDYPPDKFMIIGNEIYTFCPNGFGNTKLYTNFFEKKMGVKGTARNWKTVSSIYGIAEKKLSGSFI